MEESLFKTKSFLHKINWFPHYINIFYMRDKKIFLLFQ